MPPKRKTSYNSVIKEVKSSQLQERDSLTLLSRPLTVLKYFGLAVGDWLRSTAGYLLTHKPLLVLLLIVAPGVAIASQVQGPHLKVLHEIWVYLEFIVYWVGLGVLSSIGLGTGLHTFVLYLGPHIMNFTLKATACGRTDLKIARWDTPQWAVGSSWQDKHCADFGPPDPRFPHSLGDDCYTIPVWNILREVQLETLLWGLGTAIGELPPYFVARHARLSGERLKDIEQIEKLAQEDLKSGSMWHRLECMMARIAENGGITGIILFASIPNPFFDLAGMTCGHLLVPFASFFLATVIGKALIKSHLQAVVMIYIFNATQIRHLQIFLDEKVFPRLPYVGESLQKVFDNMINSTKDKYTSDVGTDAVQASGFNLKFLWSLVIYAFLAMFSLSIIQTTARSWLVHEQRRQMAELGLLEELDASSRDGSHNANKKKKKH
eukprot:jgi/Mesvir1/12859/Mv05887-RA.1